MPRSTVQPLPPHETTKREELSAFVFICVFLFPLLSVVLIGTFGLVIWLSQVFGGH